MKKIISDTESEALLIEETMPDDIEKTRAGNYSFKKGMRHENDADPLMTASEDFDLQQPIPVYRKKNKTLIAHTIPVADLMIFELSPDHTALKVNWTSLAPRLKEVFEEIVYTLPLIPSSDRNDDGCYTFSYSDDEYNLSVVSIVINGKAALFYKNADTEQ